jgi:hypothetical protein
MKSKVKTEYRERERERNHRRQEVQERQSPVLFGYRLHATREAITRRKRAKVSMAVE